MKTLNKIFNPKYILLVIILFGSFLRLYKLSVNPPSLFGDELDLGYQAYSILKTGHDYQGNFLPIHFHSIAEWRTPLYLYSSIPTVAIFGITPLGVRLPAAIFGIFSIWMMFLFVKELLSYGQPATDKHPRALLAAALMAIAPWSLQYSRAGFEVTELLFLLTLGLYLFLKSLSQPKWLWLSVVCLVLTPWVYSTAKLFTPVLLIIIFILFRKEIFSMPARHKLYAAAAGLVVGLPIVLSTLFGGGTQRFNYISIFSDPTTQSEVGNARALYARVRGETGEGLSPSIIDRIFSNKFTFWGDKFVRNYLQAYSTDFLFVRGDPNPRQSVGMGELYRVEILPLLIGIGFFIFEKMRDRRIKILMIFWLLFAAVPSAITVDGGMHATRLILLLPPLIFFIAYGLVAIYKLLEGGWRKFFVGVVLALYLISFVFYLHEYYVAYPWNSERWWHYGWGLAVSAIKQIDSNYDRVIISTSGEPAWIFFAASYAYPPSLWQKEYPIGNDVQVSGFGKISHTGKFYFGSPDSSVQIYGLGRYIDTKTLYLANAKEDGDNLITNPEKVPAGLKLIKAIPLPSGEPAFYLFSGTSTTLSPKVTFGL